MPAFAAIKPRAKSGPARSAATAAAHPGSTDRADIAEQVFDESALAAKGRGLVPVRIEHNDLFSRSLVNSGDIARAVETHPQDLLLAGLRPLEGDLASILRDVIPGRLTELADDVSRTGNEKVLTRNGESYVALITAEQLDDLLCELRGLCL